jgi:hypothetical protein
LGKTYQLTADSERNENIDEYEIINNARPKSDTYDPFDSENPDTANAQ